MALAIVTGGGQGIGAAIATRLAADGLAVACWDIDGAAAVEHAEALTARGYRSVACECDVRDADQIEAALARSVESGGPITVLVNNAMTWAPSGDLVDIDRERWSADLDMVLGSYQAVTRAVAPVMSDGGSVVMISSVHGLLGSPGWGTYDVAKAAILQLSRVYAAELGRRGIRVNAVAPGVIAHEAGLRAYEGRADLLRQHETISVLGRRGTVDDVAGVVRFLASEDSAFVTGQTIVVDGGLTSVLQLSQVEAYSGVWPDGPWPVPPGWSGEGGWDR